MEDEDLRIVEAMVAYGGGFVRALAYCFLVADETNIAKLRLAFPKEWKQYEEMPRHEDERKKAEAQL